MNSYKHSRVGALCHRTNVLQKAPGVLQIAYIAVTIMVQWCVGKALVMWSRRQPTFLLSAHRPHKEINARQAKDRQRTAKIEYGRDQAIEQQIWPGIKRLGQ